MANAERAFIEAKIAGKKVMVFSKPGCPFCVMAKGVLKEYVGKELDPEDYEILEINKAPNCHQLQGELAKMTGARTVPRVFINGICIGGGNETEALHSNGKLREMLQGTEQTQRRQTQLRQF